MFLSLSLSFSKSWISWIAHLGHIEKNPKRIIILGKLVVFFLPKSAVLTEAISYIWTSCLYVSFNPH